MALLTALLASALSIGLGMSLVLLATTEAALSAYDRDARLLRYAARGAAALAVSDLRALSSWTGVGEPGASAELSAITGRFVDSSISPPAPWGGTVDLRRMTAQLQGESDAATPAGLPPPQWRLFAYGSGSRLVSGQPAPAYLVAWVATDRGKMLLRAAALGPRDSLAAIELTLERTASTPSDIVRVLSVRPGS